MLDENDYATEIIQKKPEQQKKRPLVSVLLLIGGGIVILGALLLAGWQVYTTNNASPSTKSPIQIKGGTGKGGTSNGQAPWENYPDVYWQTLRAQVAQGLHMNQQQIKNSLQSTFLATQTPTNNRGVEIHSTDASKWLNDLAQKQGISQNQLHTIEVTAVQQAHAVLVQQHVLTQQQADKTIRGMNQDDLNMHITEAFLMCSEGKKPCQD
jgi:hypothetical protein